MRHVSVDVCLGQLVLTVKKDTLKGLFFCFLPYVLVLSFSNPIQKHLHLALTCCMVANMWMRFSRSAYFTSTFRRPFLPRPGSDRSGPAALTTRHHHIHSRLNRCVWNGGVKGRSTHLSRNTCLRDVGLRCAGRILSIKRSQHATCVNVAYRKRERSSQYKGKPPRCRNV